MLYKVNEIFYSIQGEGYWSGKPSIFIRLAGCNLNCEWCDTNHTMTEELRVSQIITRISALIDPMIKQKPHIVITGGEPTIQNLQPLTKALQCEDFFICLETNGTHEVHGFFDWVTVSPKENGMNSIRCADELKVVMDGILDPLSFLSALRTDAWLYVQPCSENFEPAINFVKENPEWRLSLQTQKMVNIR